MIGPEADQRRMLIVEGNDDEHVVRHLHDRLKLQLKFDIRQAGDVGALIGSMPNEVVASERIAVGFVLDADDYPERRWQAVVDRLQRRSIQSPADPGQFGTVIDGKPRVGVWLMPDNVADGALEEFISTMVPQGDPVWPLAKEYIGMAEPYLHTKRSKAEIHAWLATRKRPLPMGAAIGAQSLNTDGPLCRSFAAWLKRLFG